MTSTCKGAAWRAVVRKRRRRSVKVRGCSTRGPGRGGCVSVKRQGPACRRNSGIHLCLVRTVEYMVCACTLYSLAHLLVFVLLKLWPILYSIYTCAMHRSIHRIALPKYSFPIGGLAPARCSTAAWGRDDGADGVQHHCRHRLFGDVSLSEGKARHYI